MENMNKERQCAASAAHEVRTIVSPHEMLRQTVCFLRELWWAAPEWFRNGISEPVENLSIRGSQPASVGLRSGSAWLFKTKLARPTLLFFIFFLKRVLLL